MKITPPLVLFWRYQLFYPKAATTNVLKQLNNRKNWQDYENNTLKYNPDK